MKTKAVAKGIAKSAVIIVTLGALCLTCSTSVALLGYNIGVNAGQYHVALKRNSNTSSFRNGIHEVDVAVNGPSRLYAMVSEVELGDIGLSIWACAEFGEFETDSIPYLPLPSPMPDEPSK